MTVISFITKRKQFKQKVLTYSNVYFQLRYFLKKVLTERVQPLITLMGFFIQFSKLLLNK